MRKLFCLFLFIGASMVSFGQGANPFQWLVGTWKMSTSRGAIIESWKQSNDSTLTGISVFVKSIGDTVVQETIELKLRRGVWSYNPTAMGQNNNQPVSFTIIFLKGAEFISVNPVHDFPQRIAYRRINNSLLASIEGRKNGKFGKQNFDFLLE